MGGEGLEPSEAEANNFTDRTATNYGIPAQKVGRVRFELTAFQMSRFYGPLASAICIPTVNNNQSMNNNMIP